MGKSTTASAAKQVAENPLVLIKYDPVNALALLGEAVLKTLPKFAGLKIANPAQLATASEILRDAQIEEEKVNVFLASLRERVQEAAARFADVKGFTNFKVTLTVRSWDERNQLQDGIAGLRQKRANYLAEEDRKLKQKQAEAQAEQDRINKEAANKAAAAAKKAGANPETVQTIREEVLATPAPIVESKAQTVAESAGASVTYRYYAKITDLPKFLHTCLANESLMNTLKGAIPEIEAAFRTTAQSQKEFFNYPGATFEKRAGDRQGAR